MKTVATLTDTNETGTGSVSGAVPHTFDLPQDTDNIVVKMTASVSGCGVSVVLQTTDDSGTTWYDVGRTSIVSNATSAKAEWLSTPVAGVGVKTSDFAINTSVVATGSVYSKGAGSVYGAIGTAEALSLPQLAVSGLPILSQRGRIATVIDGDVTSAASNLVTTEVYVNSQSPRS